MSENVIVRTVKDDVRQTLKEPGRATDGSHADLIVAAERFAASVADTNRRLIRGRGAAELQPQANLEVSAAFATLVEAMVAADAHGPVPVETVRALREIAGRWLFRARIWNRAYHKPHGYAGDFMTVEWMYDLEADPCINPIRPRIVNALDNLLKQVASVVAVWERRHFFAGLLRREFERRGGALRVLDVAAGGVRYLRDFLAEVVPDPCLRVTIVDQDPAAIAFCQSRLRNEWEEMVRLVNMPIRDVATALDGEKVDLIISAGLFDYLDDGSGRTLLAELGKHLAGDGLIAITNFHPADPSRLIKGWLCDWPLIYRDEAQCAALFPDELDVETSRSGNGSLVYATGRL